MVCPLCDCREAGASWLGRVGWKDKTFHYVKCARCGSLFCESMPTAQDLAQMYGPDYQDEFYASAKPLSARWNPAIRWLKKRSPGAFLDYQKRRKAPAFMRGDISTCPKGARV